MNGHLCKKCEITDMRCNKTRCLIVYHIDRNLIKNLYYDR